MLAVDAAQRARSIEETSLRAWPALTDSDFDGWRLRFANGYTRRANSITPLSSSRLPLEDKIATCERLYAERGLPTIFRLTPFAPEELDALLERRGYRLGDRVEVRARPANAPALSAPPHPPRGRVRVCGLDRWLEIFETLSGAAVENRAAHRAVLRVVPGVRRPLALTVDAEVVACGLGVLLDQRLGLFDLVTSPAHRNQGHGSELLWRALRWGEATGATESYLQVLQDNAVAQRIYARAGFQVVYRYHYREKGGARPPNP